jgi:hypothetical protein
LKKINLLKSFRELTELMENYAERFQKPTSSRKIRSREKEPKQQLYT